MFQVIDFNQRSVYTYNLPLFVLEGALKSYKRKCISIEQVKKLGTENS